MSTFPLIALALALLSPGGASSEESDRDIVQRLLSAAETMDSAAFPLAERVLRDMAEQSYEYQRGPRTAVFEYLRATGDTRALPWLREIAQLPSRDSMQPDASLDAFAIGGALNLLTELQTDDAAELNRRHVFSHPFVQIEALSNLEKLSFWEATVDVEELFCSTPRDADHHVVLSLAAEYLDASPVTAISICPCIGGVREAFAKEIEASVSNSSYFRYGNLSKTLTHLTDRLECPAD